MKRGVGVALATLFWMGRAAAQPSGQDVATAQALFEDGKRLMQQGKHDEACPKLVESQRLDPGGGTLLAIGLCHEGQGKTATAWADFNVALGQARKDGRADREQTANDHIKALEPKLTRVRVTVTAKVDGLEVKRDGALVGEAQWGTALPIDPGEHQFEASAPKKEKWAQTLPIRGEGQTIEVKIPALTDAPLTDIIPAAPPPKKDETAQKPPSKRDDFEESDGSTQRLWGGILGGVGIVGVAVGGVFGLSASSKWSDAKKASTDREKLSHDAGTAADLSTIFFIAGGVALVGGAVLYFTAPSGKSTEKSAVRRLLLEGVF